MDLIGSRNDFGIEYKVEYKDPFMGYGKIWFGGNFIGTSEEHIYIDGYLLAGLDDIYNSPEIDMLIVSDENEMFWCLYKRLFDSEDYHIHRYLRSFGTMTDDFTIFSFLYENYIHIVWKLNNDDTPFSDLNKLDVNVTNSYKINKNEYLSKLHIIQNTIRPLKF